MTRKGEAVAVPMTDEERRRRLAAAYRLLLALAARRKAAHDTQPTASRDNGQARPS